jgi:hypothetical protein
MGIYTLPGTRRTAHFQENKSWFEASAALT